MAQRPDLKGHHHSWGELKDVPQTSYRCGYCGDKVSCNKGLHYVDERTTANKSRAGVLICPECGGATFVYPVTNEIFPMAAFGSPVAHLPAEIYSLFDEARNCTSNNNFTAAVLICRKLLMHIAVAQGGKEGENFIYYVNYLANNNYIPPNGKHWVDHIRNKGNEANHEIVMMEANDAKELITFIEMLLRFIYEFPNSIPKPAAP